MVNINEMKYENFIDRKPVEGAEIVLKVCAICEQKINHNDMIYVRVLAPYQELKSAVCYAIGQPVWADPENIAHKECYEIEMGDELNAR